MPWALGDWKTTYIGQGVGVAVIAVASIFIAFIYKWLLQKVNTMWAGVGFGALLWIIVFYICNPFIPGLKVYNRWGFTHSSHHLVCLFSMGYLLDTPFLTNINSNNSHSKKTFHCKSPCTVWYTRFGY